MKIITVNLPEPHIKALKLLQEVGMYPSRSEAIRVALRDFLRVELGFSKDKDISNESLKPELTVEERKKEISRLIRKLEMENLQVSTINH